MFICISFHSFINFILIFNTSYR